MAGEIDESATAPAVVVGTFTSMLRLGIGPLVGRLVGFIKGAAVGSGTGVALPLAE